MAFSEALDEAVVTSVLLAGEELAAPMRQADRGTRAPVHAVPVRSVPPLETDYDWMVDVVRYAAARLAGRPSRGQLAAVLTECLGDGQGLAYLFHRFFPRRAGVVHMDSSGKTILTPRQVQILREAAKGLSHAEIAQQIGVAVRTVTTHVDQIHRRLGVTRTVQAIARAVALGYLDADALTSVAQPILPGEMGAVQAFLAEAGRLEGGSPTQSLRRLAQFGLLLTLASAAAAMTLQYDDVAETPRVGAVARVTLGGEVLQVFGSDRLRSATALAVAPRWATLQGYVPGNVFVVNNDLPQVGLNTAEIVEYTPDGVEVGGFCGSTEVGTRLTGTTSAAFDRRGRLLATSGALTNALLEFTAGGRKVNRFATVSASQVAVAPDGSVCVATDPRSGPRLMVYNPDGQTQSEGPALDPSAVLTGLAVLPSGNRVVCRSDRGSAVLEELDAGDDVLRSRALSGIGAGRLHVGHNGMILLTPQPEGNVYLLDEHLRPVRRVSVSGISVRSAVTSPDGTLWIAGQME